MATFKEILKELRIDKPYPAMRESAAYDIGRSISQYEREVFIYQDYADNDQKADAQHMILIDILGCLDRAIENSELIDWPLLQDYKKERKKWQLKLDHVKNLIGDGYKQISLEGIDEINND